MLLQRQKAVRTCLWWFYVCSAKQWVIILCPFLSLSTNICKNSLHFSLHLKVIHSKPHSASPQISCSTQAWQLYKEIHAPLFSARKNGTGEPWYFLYMTASGTQAQTQTSKQCVKKWWPLSVLVDQTSWGEVSWPNHNPLAGLLPYSLNISPFVWKAVDIQVGPTFLSPKLSSKMACSKPMPRFKLTRLL